MEFRLLGPVQAWHDGTAVFLGRRRERCLLGILLLEAGSVVPVDRLIDLLWDGDPPATARATVSAHVSRLRHQLDPAGDAALGVRIGGPGNGYLIEVRRDLVDVHRFAALVAQARGLTNPVQRSARLRTALALWRGPLMADVATDELRDRVGGDLAEARMAAVELAIEADLAAGRAEDAVIELSALVKQHPMREGLRARLMLALYRCGRTAEALTAFRDSRALLVSELGIEPGPELQGMHERILARDPGLAASPTPPDVVAPVRNDLPRDIADFTGRDRETRRLFEVFDGEPGTTAVSISAIDGMAGIGKTALAVHVAHRLTDRCPDGALFLDLRSHSAGQDPLPPAAALDTLLRALGVPADQIPDELDQRAALWRTELAHRRVVIVLDNAASAAQVRPLLPGVAGSLALITSRRRMSDLEAAHQISLDALPLTDAVDLFARVAGAERATAELAAVAEVVRLCGLLPLAIRIAAARLRSRPSWTVAHLAQRLSEAQNRLDELVTGDSSVAAAFAMSYQRLDPDHQRLFRRLGLVPAAEFDEYLGAALTGTDPGVAGRVLEDLVDANLVQQPVPGRYRLHDLLREHAAALARAGEPVEARAEVTGRMLDYYLQATAQAMALVDPRGIQIAISLDGDPPALAAVPDRAAAMSFLDTEYDNLIAVIGFAGAQGRHTHTWQLAHLLQYYFSTRALTQDWLATHRTALASTRALGDRLAQADTLRNLGHACWAVTRHDEAIDYLGQALALHHDAGNERGEGDTLNALGMTYYRMGRYEDAVRHYQRALVLRRAAGSRRGEAGTLQNLAIVYDLLGRREEAAKQYRGALAINVEIDDLRGQAIILCNLGTGEEELGRYAQALSLYQRALALVESAGDRSIHGGVLTNLGSVYCRLKRYPESIDHHVRALDSAYANGDRDLECAALNNLGEARYAAGQPTEAVAAHERALVLALDLQLSPEEARAHHGIGTALRADDPAAACEHWQLALARYDELHVPAADQLRAELLALGAASAG